MRIDFDSDEPNTLRELQEELKVKEQNSDELVNLLAQSNRVPGMVEQVRPSGELDEPSPTDPKKKKDFKPGLSTSLLVYEISDDKEELELLDDLGGVRESALKKAASGE